MRSAASTAQSLSQRTSLIESDEVMSVFTHSGPISAKFCLSPPLAMELGAGDQLNIEILDGVMVLKPVRDTTTAP